MLQGVCIRNNFTKKLHFFTNDVFPQLGPNFFDLKQYPFCASSKLCELFSSLYYRVVSRTRFRQMPFSMYPLYVVVVVNSKDGVDGEKQEKNRPSSHLRPLLPTATMCVSNFKEP